MRCWAWMFPSLLAIGALSADEPLTDILNRVSEEAEVFRMLAPKFIGEETLKQKARKNPRRFQLRIGADATTTPMPKFRSREIVSEYGFATLAEAPDALLEIRHVVSIDGRRVAVSGKARNALSLGIRNNDERAKRKMLERFRKHGLKGAATDFGQVILLFRRRNLEKYDFRQLREARFAARDVIVVGFAQRQGSESFTVFKGRQATHAPLQGELWVRKPDYVPLRIILRNTIEEGKFQRQHVGTVDYSMNPRGVLLPVAVSYQQRVERELLVETKSKYTNFQMFAVESEIKFTSADEALPEEPAPSKP